MKTKSCSHRQDGEREGDSDHDVGQQQDVVQDDGEAGLETRSRCLLVYLSWILLSSSSADGSTHLDVDGLPRHQDGLKGNHRRRKALVRRL